VALALVPRSCRRGHYRAGPMSLMQQSAMIATMRARYGLVALSCLAGLPVLVGPSFTSASVPVPPPTFVVVTDGGLGLRSQMSVYSSITGDLVRPLASFSDKAFTNNGLAYAPDGSAVYFTLIPQHNARRFSLRLMRLNVATGHETFVAEGAQPALSNDGTQLAYGASPRGLAVRDLASGQTRTIGLGQLGTAANLLNATIGWLGDGSDIAIIPAPTPWDLVGRPPKLHWCGTTQTRAVIVFVHVPAPPAPMTADCVHLAGRALDGSVALTGDSASPANVLAATDSYGDKTRVERIAETGAISRVLTIPNSLPLSFDPTGTHLLYLVGHSPPALTEASIANGQLINGPWRNPHLRLEALAW
jgi:hypothetical protein